MLVVQRKCTHRALAAQRFNERSSAATYCISKVLCWCMACKCARRYVDTRACELGDQRAAQQVPFAERRLPNEISLEL